MNEQQMIKKDRLKTYIILSMFVYGVFVSFFGMLVTLEYENELTYLFTFSFLMSAPLVFLIVAKNQQRFEGKRIGCDVYSFKHLTYDELLKRVHDYAMNNEYSNIDELITGREEEFTVYSKNKPDYLDYPKDKICVYYHPIYLAEVWEKVEHKYSESKSNYTFGKTEQVEFQKMVCGNWGRHYKYPRDWVDIETILIIMVDEWNETLNWVMNHSGNLPFVLVALMVKTDPDVIYVTKDIHKHKRDDYQEKCNELFDLLDLKNRFVVRTLKYSDIKKIVKDESKDRIKGF